MKVLFLDCFSGISGDMTVGALCDLGVKPSTLEWELSKLEIGDFHMHFEREQRHHLEGVRFSIHEGATHTHDQDEHDHDHECEQCGGHGHEHGHSHSHSHSHTHSHTHEHGEGEHDHHHHHGDEEHAHAHSHGEEHGHHHHHEHEHAHAHTHEGAEPATATPAHDHDHGAEIHAHAHQAAARDLGPGHKAGVTEHTHSHTHTHTHEHEHGHGHHHHHHHDEEGHDHDHGHDHVHGRNHREIRELIEKSDLSPFVKQHALSIFQRIAVAEGKIHGQDPAEVGFHEVGALDSIADIICACVGLEALGVEKVYFSSLHDGRGFIDCAHGRFPLPAPATLEILQGVPLGQIDEPHELITPTGAAIAAEFGVNFGLMPKLKTEKIGYGIGTRKLASRPNVLRAVLGELAE